MSDVYAFEADSLTGQSVPLSQYRGKVLLIVNVASECGFTPQYKGLEELHKQLGAKGLAVVGVPCNQFGEQEPGTEKEIATFCESRFGVTFPMFGKVHVKGPNQAPLFHFLLFGGIVIFLLSGAFVVLYSTFYVATASNARLFADVASLLGILRYRAAGERERAAFRRTEVGFVFQRFNLFAHMSVLDNLVLALMEKEGVSFRANADVGVGLPVRELQREHDAVVLACGAGWPRDLPVPGRELSGIHFAMDYLTLQNKRCEGDVISDEAFITASGKRVVIIGGGDTGADCLGTVHRQGALSVHQFELLPRPPDTRAPDNPWPQWPNIFRVSSAHEEGGERVYSVSTQRFIGGASGSVRALKAIKVEMIREGGRLDFRPIAGTAFELPVDLVLLAMGFLGPERPGPIQELGLKLTERGNVWRDQNWMTSAPGVFTCGDMQRGQSLIVWAIAEGRSCSRGVDRYLMGKSELPAPL